MTDAQIAYERKRAAKANKSLDEWLKIKAKQEAKVAAARPEHAGKTKKPGLLKRLVERGHKPI
ncbi:hypothetical protein L2A60_15580 [Acidiphilium iwatense]|uniref:Uncharacterized protein n=2 Tax=Acidiphilium iwatense TaxID=768198 RepID=A0ABS9DZA8_9PROT|nr:hypothetical protein [Acidiphilium sp. AL]MCF3948096.1 hypothetical protein [Acidiphilium iwatense]